MNKLIIQDKPKTAWVKYPDGPDEYLVPFMPFFSIDIDKPDSELNQLSDDEFFKRMIQDWKNVSFDGKTDAECTPENIKKLIESYPERYAFILEKLQSAVPFMEKKEQDEKLKNSDNSLPLEQTTQS